MLNNYRAKKVCLKCGEVYKKLNFLWQINRNSGIPYVKKEYKILICENGIMFFSPPGQIKLNTRRYTYCVSHHDKRAVEEIENDRCIMKDCDGILKSFTGDKYEFLSQEKRNEYFPKYFGEDGSDISEFDNMNLMLVFPNEMFITTRGSH